MPDITIPPAALEAAAKADHIKWIDYASVGDDRSQCPTWEDLDAEQKAEAIERARAACLAMLNAWPGMYEDSLILSGAGTAISAIILPSRENPNAES